MKSKKYGIIKLIIVMSIALLLHTHTLHPKTDSNSKFKKQLQKINSQVEDVNKKLEALKSDKKSILNDIYSVELRQEKEVIENNKVKLQLRQTQEKIDAREKEKKVLEKEVAKSRKNLEKIVRILYKLGGNSYLKIFIRVDTIDQLFKNYRLFLSLIDIKTQEINKIKKNIERLNRVKNQLKLEYRNLKDFQELKEAKLRNIYNLKQSKLRMLRNINNNRTNFMQMLDELKYEASRLDQVIVGKKVESSLRVLDKSKIRGRLPWPVKGKIISRYGKKKSTRFNTYIINNGIEIRPRGSDKIKSVYTGDVVFADYYKGYGKMIIIQHSRDIYTMYGHCATLYKKKGEHVMGGEVIAIVGSSGSVIGKSVYFELRDQRKAVNPIPWLRRQ